MELNPAPTKKFFNSGASPMQKLLSGVKLSGPFMKVLMSAFSSGRTSTPIAARIPAETRSMKNATPAITQA